VGHTQLGGEQVEDLGQCGLGGFAGLVDQVCGEHGMVTWQRPVGVAVVLGQRHGDEAVAQALAEEGEPLGGDEGIALKAQSQHAQAGVGAASCHDGKVCIAAVDGALAGGGDRQRKGRLGQDGRDDDDGPLPSLVRSRR
jgi:hypothetical protein